MARPYGFIIPGPFKMEVFSIRQKQQKKVADAIVVVDVEAKAIAGASL